MGSSTTVAALTLYRRSGRRRRGLRGWRQARGGRDGEALYSSIPGIDDSGVIASHHHAFAQALNCGVCASFAPLHSPSIHTATILPPQPPLHSCHRSGYHLDPSCCTSRPAATALTAAAPRSRCGPGATGCWVSSSMISGRVPELSTRWVRTSFVQRLNKVGSTDRLGV